MSKYIEFTQRVNAYVPGDRVHRDDRAAENLIAQNLAREIGEEEREAIQNESEDTGPDLSVQVKYHERDPDEPYNPGDIRWTDEETADRLVEQNVAEKMKVLTEDVVSESKSDPEVRNRMEREAKLDELDEYDYYTIRSFASDVAERIEVEPEDQSETTLKDFLCDHWADFKAVESMNED